MVVVLWKSLVLLALVLMLKLALVLMLKLALVLMLTVVRRVGLMIVEQKLDEDEKESNSAQTLHPVGTRIREGEKGGER